MVARRPFIPLVSVLVLLPGCLLTDLWQTRAEICRGEYTIGLDPNEIRIRVRNPLVLDRDVVCLVEAAPAAVDVAPSKKVLWYVVEKDGEREESRYHMPVGLVFESKAGDFRLSQGFVSRNLTQVIPTALIRQMLQTACVARESLLRRSLDIDLSTVDRALLPTRNDVIAAFGDPNADSVDGATLAYRYSIASRDGQRKTAEVSVWFESDGRLQRLQGSYLGYRLAADFDQATARVTVQQQTVAKVLRCAVSPDKS